MVLATPSKPQEFCMSRTAQHTIAHSLWPRAPPPVNRNLGEFLRGRRTRAGFSLARAPVMKRHTYCAWNAAARVAIPVRVRAGAL